LPIPDSFPQEQENRNFSYAYLGRRTDGTIPEEDGPAGRAWTERGSPGPDSRAAAQRC